MSLRPNGGRMPVILLAFVACTREESSDAASQATTEPASVAVEVTPVERRALEGTIRLQGEIHPFQEVDLYARVPGFVSEVLVDRGSRVERGDVLVRLRAPEMQAERRQLEAGQRGEQSTLRRLELARKTKGAVAEHEVELAEARSSAADAKVRSIRTLERYLVIDAPFEGVVSERLVHPGALVDPGDDTPLLRLEAIDTVRLTVAIPEAWVGAVSIGQTVQFDVLAWPGRKFAGVVKRTAERVDPGTRTMSVELDVDNDGHALVPGMYAEVLWPLRRATESAFVPRTAIVDTTRDTFVIAVREGIARRVHVERGAITGDTLEVFGALEPGDFVLTRGREDIEDGTPLETRTGTAIR